MINFGTYPKDISDVTLRMSMCERRLQTNMPLCAHLLMPKKFVRELPGRGGWDPRDVADMANVTEDEYVKIFKSLKRDDFKFFSRRRFVFQESWKC